MGYSRFFFSALLASAVLAVSNRAEAQSAFSAQLIPNGAEQTINLPVTAGVGSLWFEIPGNISEGINFSVTAPAGTIFRLDGSNVKFPRETLLNGDGVTGWHSLQVYDSQGTENPIIVLYGSNSRSTSSATTRATRAAASDSSGSCSGMSSADINNIIQTFSQFFGIQLSYQDICGTFGSSSGSIPGATTSTPADPFYSDNSSSYEDTYFEELSTYFDSYLRKDACSAPATHLYRLVTDINSVSPAALAAGATIKISVTRNIFKGKKGSTIKPKSDGRFSPNPLVLMSTANVYPETIEVNQWYEGGINSTKFLKIQDYVGYRGLTLARAVGTSVLKGKGSASFDITNRQNGGYSVCFELKKSRQKKNGYK